MNLVQSISAYTRVKSYLDLVFSGLFLILLSPLFLVISVLIKIDSSGPVFHRQHRLGINQQFFEIYKFRTMTHDETRKISQTLPGSPDITRIGNLLRRLKLDELPQLINVLQGDMSFIGPRPCLPKALEQIDKQYNTRFNIKPGLTGLAQVNGNIYIDWNRRCQYDIEYINTVSATLDLKILLKTVLVILLGEQRMAR